MEKALAFLRAHWKKVALFILAGSAAVFAGNEQVAAIIRILSGLLGL